MAKNIAIKVPGKHPQTGELTTFELKGQRMDIDIGGQAVPFSSTFGVSEPHKFTNSHTERLVAEYGSLHLLDRLNCKPVINP